MNNFLISIFVPVFNAELYLKKCIDSILAQTYKNFELILMDDGSTDSSVKICQYYVEKDDRVKLFNYEHGSIKKMLPDFYDIASGDYIAQIDNDDYVAPDFLETLYTSIVINNSEVSICSYFNIDEQDKKLNFQPPLPINNIVLYEFDALKKYLTTLEIEGFRWNMLFKKTIYTENNITFVNTYPVDIPFKFDILSKSKVVSFVPKRLYFYRKTTSSDTNNMNLLKYRGFLNTFDKVADKAALLGLKKESNYFRIWRKNNILYVVLRSGIKSRRHFKEIKKDFSWKKDIGISLFSALKILLEYKDEMNGPLKLIIKTILVRIFL